MQTYRVETTVSDDGTLTLREIPFHAGDHVEVILRSQTPQQKHNGPYPLRGKPIRYDRPFAGAADRSWNEP